MFSPASVYELRQSASLRRKLVFDRRDDALAALIEHIVLYGWTSGLQGAAVYEYDVPYSVRLPKNHRLKRRWFFRTLGTPMPTAHQILEHIGSSKDRRRFVLHVHNYQNSRTEPVYVLKEPVLPRKQWMRCYWLAHWLFNASRSDLRNAARLLNMSWHTKWIKTRTELRKKIFAHAAKCADRLRQMQLPSRATVFAFETRGIHLRVSTPASFVRA